jgi:hypothetical protein
MKWSETGLPEMQQQRKQLCYFCSYSSHFLNPFYLHLIEQSATMNYFFPVNWLWILKRKQKYSFNGLR